MTTLDAALTIEQRLHGRSNNLPTFFSGLGSGAAGGEESQQLILRQVILTSSGLHEPDLLLDKPALKRLGLVDIYLIEAIV